ncbi:thioredoxin-disulfide reductase [bacterium]|nr:thioredoxin-disulfide reductase [bacterium]
MTEATLYDTVIIGAGPAGLAAAVYTARGRMNTLILEKGPTGGQIALTELVENYPGFPDGETGVELADMFLKQAQKFGAVMKNAEVKNIRENGKTYTLSTDQGDIETRTIICAMGADPRKLNVPGEDSNVGTGVSYCATCDGFFFRGKDVIVVGGGDAAVEESIFLTKFANSVTIVHRRDQLRASKILQERAFSNEKVHFIWDTVVTEIVSNGKVEKVLLENVKTGETKEHPIDGVFIFIGHVPNTDLVKDMLEMDDLNLIKVDLLMRSSKPGIFACGDCRTDAARQMVSSAGDGSTAAISAIKYVDEQMVEEGN